jgi:hypothetical protein
MEQEGVGIAWNTSLYISQLPCPFYMLKIFGHLPQMDNGLLRFGFSKQRALFGYTLVINLLRGLYKADENSVIHKRRRARLALFLKDIPAMNLTKNPYCAIGRK